MNPITVVKIGGNVLDDARLLQDFLQQFAALEGPKILVHGGGKIATEIGMRLGIASQYVAGRRITDEATLDLVTMVYGGLLNKRLVAALQALGCPALGLCGADGNCIPARRRAVKELDYGFVGDVSEAWVQTAFLETLFREGLAPVVAPLTHDGNGSLLNTNADSIAQVLAAALSQKAATRLVYCFEKAGVLRDVHDEASVIPEINSERWRDMKKNGQIAAGMIPKLEHAFAAGEAGVNPVIIGHAAAFTQLLDGAKGTRIL